MSNIVDVPGSSTRFGLRRDWLFIGGFQHRPNIDAVLFFVQKIYPLVSGPLADAKFYIIGDKAPPEIVALANDNVIVAGIAAGCLPVFREREIISGPTAVWSWHKGEDKPQHGLRRPCGSDIACC